MARLYTNENFPLAAVEHLRALGHDVLTAYDSGRANQAITDEDVLAFAREHSRVLITFNRRHFVALHNKRSDHAGIVVCSVDSDLLALAQRIHNAIEAHADMRGALVRVNRPA
ncbi:MAG: DUF5615 family PIN-like protein [Anaerolineae bacterium]|nr:DUF5615 family PIN-like protein [Anaerolineae bacterium]